MASIKAIESRSVHQIQSGQVIVDLNSVVKELVENSLDAAATSIEIRFRNHGLDGIEVQDNGRGIAPPDFFTVALKHHTSKLASYEDLAGLHTFGFRGEALSSLCALSRFHIVTARAEDGAVGRRLDFEVSGALKETSVQAAPKGTTAVVEDLFCNLPVRRRELEKNVKREYGKVVGLLYAYACISVGVRMSVTNQMPKGGKKIAVFATQPNLTTKENITNVFGAKTITALVALDLRLQMEPSNTPPVVMSSATHSAAETQATNRSQEIHIQGHISKPVFGDGRHAPDRQMFFVNSRPCTLPQVAKAFNEVYRSFNVAQTPFVFANLVMDTNAYDVNVSPDKRTIMLHDQTALLDKLKTALTELFERTDQTVPFSQLGSSRKLPDYHPLTFTHRGSTEDDPPLENDDPENGGEDEDGVENESNVRANGRPEDETAATPPAFVGNWTIKPADQRSETAPHPKNTTQPFDLLDSTKTAPDSSSSTRSPSHLRRVRDFNALMEGGSSSQAMSLESDKRGVDVTAVQRRIQTEGEEPIAIITPSSQKAIPGPIQNAFDRMRPNRVPLRTACITVGDTTTTTVLGGGPPYKKRRVRKHAAVDSGENSRLLQGIRGFAAPGSRLESEGGGRDVLMESDEKEESSEEENDAEADDVLELPKFASTEASDISGEAAPSSHSPGVPSVASDDDDYEDPDHLGEEDKKAKEDEKVARLIEEAELAVVRPSEANVRRAARVFMNGGNRKGSTLRLTRSLSVSIDSIRSQALRLKDAQKSSHFGKHNEVEQENTVVRDDLDDSNAEKRLSLTVSKTDFDRMNIVGQFNLGFILAVRPAFTLSDGDELFIIDQHAADEKYNYERLQRTVTLQNQRLVQPKALDLTAVEQETVLNNPTALKANGFEVETTHISDDDSSRRFCHLVTLPVSGEKTFDLSDLEELLHLLSEAPAGGTEIPRPKKVQRMLAMRACRSSIMVGKTLTLTQMRKVVSHMGEMEKPWNCPHGRPTMRHIAGLGAWREWPEGQVVDEDDNEAIDGASSGKRTDWKVWLEERDG